MNLSVDAALTECLETCPLCGGTSWKTLPVPGRWIGQEVFAELIGQIGLVRCCSCGLHFINPRPANARLSAFYSGDTYSCHEPTGSASAGAKADFLLQRIDDYLPSEAPRVLLDYGAGGGAFLLHAQGCGWKVQGFEPGQRGLDSCRRSGLKVTDQLQDLPQQEYGLVTLHHVFEHLTDPTEVLDGIRPLLERNGRLFLEVPNVKSLRARLALPFLSRRFPIDERYRGYPIHLMYYCNRTLRRMLNRAGWTVEATFTSGLGTDEFFLHSRAPQDRSAAEEHTPAALSSPKRRLRHRLRDAYLACGFGECLAAIARPNS